MTTSMKETGQSASLRSEKVSDPPGMERCILYRRVDSAGSLTSTATIRWFTNLLAAASGMPSDEFAFLSEGGPVPVTALKTPDGRYYPLNSPGENEIRVVR